MQPCTRTLLALSISCSFILLGKTSSAQYPGMSAVRAQQNRQFVNQQMNTMLQMNGLWGANGVYNEKHTFIITMLDSSKKETYSKIYMDTVVKKMYLLLVDKNLKRSDTNRVRKIYPSQTLSIARNLIPPSTNAVRQSVIPKSPVYYTGKPSDSCWMFKIISGSINAFSYLSEEDNNVFDPSTIVGVQLNDGPIVKCSMDNLKEMIGQTDVDALQILLNGNYFRAINKYNRDNKKSEKK